MDVDRAGDVLEQRSHFHRQGELAGEFGDVGADAWTPRIRWSSALAVTRTNPSLSAEFIERARPLALNGKRPVTTSLPMALASSARGRR